MKALIKILPLIVILSMFLGSIGIMAATQSRLVDDADLLTSSEEAELLKKLNAISEKYGHDIAVVTVNTLDEKSPEKFTEDYYIEHGYGMGDTDSGILLMVCITTRDYLLLARGECLDIFSDSDLIDLEDVFISDLSNGYYYDAFDAYADKCEYIIKYDKRLEPFWIVISIIVGVVVAFIVIKSMTSKHKNVKMQSTANSYMLRNTFRLDRSRDVYLYSHVTRVHKPQNNSSSGGGRSSGGGGGSRSRGGKF